MYDTSPERCVPGAVPGVGFMLINAVQGWYKPRHRWLETDFGLKPRFPLNQWFETKPNRCTQKS